MFFTREIKKVKETKKIFDKMGYDLSKYDIQTVIVVKELIELDCILMQCTPVCLTFIKTENCTA